MQEELKNLQGNIPEPEIVNGKVMYEQTVSDWLQGMSVKEIFPDVTSIDRGSLTIDLHL